ncbi:methyltransferase domain-containing protein [Terriglobus saanensis]|uniref:Methyltransferase type 12 n=1 Tax=Terriglobus saanensis (strain ATCC BAA-1853 / DSM 23119 / SP1PR4) TaxID=401053 RepID=E8V2B2_TERSS|nr:methyltransferase domain-containing protein [Terriglobus saanensis]ADV81245.1 Methyltransferase type 12 [Terriglobus saanensis SP1PR4]
MSSDAMDFSHRADLSEWMDEPCSYEDFRGCLRDLSQVNYLTLAYRPTMHWLKQIARVRRGQTLHIVDVGCGGGDMLRRIEGWAVKEGVRVRLTGIDLNPHSARVAREFTAATSRIEWITGDAFSYAPQQPIDCIVSSLFTHHLPDAEIVRFLAWMERMAVRGWFINDLSRAKVPYYAFKVLATAAHWHRFVRNDGPISIRRAFSPEDWQRYLCAAEIGVSSISIESWKPARLCVSRVK